MPTEVGAGWMIVVEKDVILQIVPVIAAAFFGGLAGTSLNIWYQHHLSTIARKGALKSLRDEAQLNKDYAERNARIAGDGNAPWVFIRFRTTASERLLLSAAFKIEAETRTICSDYLRGLDHVNAMMRRAETFGSFQEAMASVKAIHRYCSGQLDPRVDAGATSIPDSIQELLNHLDTTYPKELGL